MANQPNHVGQDWELEILIARRYSEGWMLTANPTILRCTTGSNRDLLTVTAGRRDITTIILREVRWYIRNNKKVTNYEMIANETKSAIYNRMEKDGYFQNYEHGEVAGALVLLDRNQKDLLTIVVHKGQGEQEYKIFHTIKERQILGSTAKLVESQADKMSDSDDRETAKNWMLTAVGSGIIILGGENVVWSQAVIP